jgi:four helix bundle protein
MSAIKNFRTYDLAVQFHHSCIDMKLPQYLRDQMLRASSSIALNLSEGSAKPTLKDRLKYYRIALGSLRECQAALDLNRCNEQHILQLADKLGASLYCLCKQESRG